MTNAYSVEVVDCGVAVPFLFLGVYPNLEDAVERADDYAKELTSDEEVILVRPVSYYRVGENEAQVTP